MNSARGHQHDPRDVDAEFARMLEGEGLVLRPGEAPREPAADEPDEPDERSTADEATGPEGPEIDDDLPPGAESPPEPPSEEARARARAAHPSTGPGRARGSEPRELDDDEVLFGDFVPPDPDLPESSSAALWAWTALIGGFLLLMAVTFSPGLSPWLGWLGGGAAVGGLVALLMRAPRGRRDDGDGAQV